MAADPFDALRLTVMQDLLPVGVAVAQRVQRGGARELLAAFDGSRKDPLGELRQEGEPLARRLREDLDRLQPGLGNPVLKVEVRDVEPQSPPPASDSAAAAAVPAGAAASAGNDPAEPMTDAESAQDPRQLLETLARIEGRLTLLESRLGAAAG
ncbi:MAG: hypothetical protein VKI83_02825 [Synechococcaceae cyanobacterium]|nr:hypothetical protein [Synechococcaceae cyanobacterium]